MKDTITCPSCNVENPRGRLTCQVCHDPLTPKQKEVKKVKMTIEGEAKKGVTTVKVFDPKTPLPPSPPTSKVTSPNPFPEKQTPKDTDSIIVPKAIITKIPKEAKAPVKRRARRKSHTPIESQYFMLQNGTLIPVQIIQTVRKLKKKAIGIQAQGLMSLWNRNKSLITK